MCEQSEVRYGNSAITYTVVRSPRRRKTVEITLDSVDGVHVAAPVDASPERIAAIVTRRAGWITRRMAAPDQRPRRKEFVSGESLPYLGRQVRLFVTEDSGRRVRVRFTHWSFALTVPKGLAGEERRAATEREMTRWYKRRAADYLPRRVRRWATVAGYEPAAVLIRSQRQRWGSSTADGIVRLNWRIIMAPPRLIDYVVVHELAHLRVRHHSAAYWAEVQRLLPDYRLRRARLKELGAGYTL